MKQHIVCVTAESSFLLFANKHAGESVRLLASQALLDCLPAHRDADRVAGLLEANGIYNVKLLVNRVRPDMIARNDMMSVKDVQEMLGIPLLGAIPEDEQVGGTLREQGSSHWPFMHNGQNCVQSDIHWWSATG